ncbi:hypothetical protein B0E45_06080 [Sinorhizobium sp. A49]|uniref:hypothetical protein n=1 Tax=Sinorhizobium sp. A49 TaxID=1945861 RepID=UPI0009879C0A|nr:hypothetical protein [Sinorhizobium sp. A49]OOG73857.1 hypothetical protein B0E45_06080 [Sinorhizobium sp. A49]
MNWLDQEYRIVLMCGDVDVGAVYPPSGRAKVWRWRVRVTKSGHPVKGNEASRAAAVAHVERRFRSFLTAAGLVSEGGAV